MLGRLGISNWNASANLERGQHVVHAQAWGADGGDRTCSGMPGGHEAARHAWDIGIWGPYPGQNSAALHALLTASLRTLAQVNPASSPQYYVHALEPISLYNELCVFMFLLRSLIKRYAKYVWVRRVQWAGRNRGMQCLD